MTPTTDVDATADASRTRLFRCTNCGNYHPARRAADGSLKPTTGGVENRCRRCGGHEFVRVTLDHDEQMRD